MSLALLFPGQGSQFAGMGRDLARDFPEAAEVFEHADDILGFRLSRLAWEGPGKELVETRNAQPAILVHALAAFAVVRTRLGPIGFAAGHSLGEFSAHAAAGTFGFESAVRMVRYRGELMQKAGRSRPGAMAAILGLGEAELRAACRAASRQGRVCVPANFNARGQIVISGDQGAVTRAARLAREAGARRALPLPVSGAFHSPLMAAAKERLREHLDSVVFAPPAFPVISNVTAEPVEKPRAARELLVRQLTSPVLWRRSMRTMAEAGVSRFLELGPGSVLAGLTRRNVRGIPCMSVGTPQGVRKLFSDPTTGRGRE